MAIRRTMLHVEELGSRVLPSASPFTLYGVAPATMHVIQNEHTLVKEYGQLAEQSLHGMGFGSYANNFNVPDTGASYHLNGLGVFSKLGFATVSGDIHGVGFIQHGHATGTLTLTNAHGSVTIELTGPVQDGFSPLPYKFQYQVTGGTGAYQNFHDTGTLQLQLIGSTGPPGSPGHGVFTLWISG